MTEAKKINQFLMKFRKNENPLLLEWFKLQSVPSDSIRYLIEKEIATNGLRNLQHFIPAKRDIETLRHYSLPEGVKKPSQPVPVGSSFAILDNTNSEATGKKEPEGTQVPHDVNKVDSDTSHSTEPETKSKPKKTFNADTMDSYM